MATPIVFIHPAEQETHEPQAFPATMSQVLSMSYPIFEFNSFDLMRNYHIEDYPSQHDGWNCRGNCARHPLMVGDALAFQTSIRNGASWGDLVLRDEAIALAAESEVQRHARITHDAELEAAARLNEEAIKREVYARDVALRARKGLRKNDAVVKRAEPCKWVVGQFAGDECWAHEYTCPKTRNRVIKHTCDRLHPNEAGWCNEWIANPRWRPAPPPTRTFDGLGATNSVRHGKRVETSGW
jgi:hypothetical protein